MKIVSTQGHSQDVDCFYGNEKYSVRDNGAILRHIRSGKRLRSLNNQWTFGKPSRQTGYMFIGQVRVHRIVATAFHGEPPTPQHVVDHRDTNRRNNRPENLRWLTRLENVLNNPVTLKRIEYRYGSLETFLADPSKPLPDRPDSNFDWMRTVSQQEAQACRERMDQWARSDKPTSGNGSLGEWVYKPIQRRPPTSYPAPSDFVISKTAGAIQRKWRTPTEFPCCPHNSGQQPILDYARKLTTGATFARNKFSTAVVQEAALTEDGESIFVMGETDGLKPWSLAQITFEKDLYVHTSKGTFFEKDGAKKAFCIAQGLEWEGGDTFDDFC